MWKSEPENLPFYSACACLRLMTCDKGKPKAVFLLLLKKLLMTKVAMGSFCVGRMGI